MADTLGDLKERIAREMTRDDLATEIAEAITDAINLWSPRRFDFNEKRVKRNTVANTEYYALGSGWTYMDDSSTDGGYPMKVDSITLLYDQQPYPLSERTHAWIDTNQSPAATYTGQPDSYGTYDRWLRLYPIPDAAYQLTLSGLFYAESLSSDADSNMWTQAINGEAIVRHQVKSMIYRDLLRDDNGAARSQQALLEVIASREKRNELTASVGRIAPWTL